MNRPLPYKLIAPRSGASSKRTAPAMRACSEKFRAAVLADYLDSLR